MLPVGQWWPAESAQQGEEGNQQCPRVERGGGSILQQLRMA